MKAFFEAIQYLFENFIFAPYTFFRFMDGWWSSNLVNWLFVITASFAFVYWLLQLRLFDANNEEDQSISSHSYL